MTVIREHLAAFGLASALVLGGLGEAWAEGRSDPSGGAPELPPTPAEPVVDTLHGVEIVDPYRWLEGSAAPEIEGEDAALDDRVRAWSEAQSDYARARLDAIPGREQVAERLGELLDLGEISDPKLAGGRIFLLERAADEEQARLTVREGPDAEPRTLLDPNRLDADGLTSLGWYEPSPDGLRVAFGLVQGGDEKDVRIRLLEVATGRWLADEIPGRAGNVSWRPDGESFVYRRLADPEDPYSESVRYHRVGLHRRQDRVLFDQESEGPLATTWGPRGELAGDGRWLILKYWTSTSGHDLWVADFELWLETGELDRREVHVGETAKTDAVVVGDRLLLHTTLGAPNGRVMVADLESPGVESWRELVPEHDRAVVRGLAVGDGVLAVEYLEAAVSRIERFGLDGRRLGAMSLPGPGAADLIARQGSDGALLTFVSFNTPQSVYRADLKSGRVEPWLRPETTVDPDSVEVRQVFYPSSGGARVPMFVIHRKGLELDGARPTLVYAYGGFGFSWSPRFDPSWFLLFERDAVVAVANLRGGGELGESWHRAGMRENKPQVTDDWIAAHEWLIAEGYTRPGRLAIATGSNGGIAAASMMNRRPDLVAAAVIVNPLLDMLRYQSFLLARYWVPEYGSAEDPEEFAWLRGYSPYHHVQDEAAYPAVLLEASANDARVHAMHSYKYAARLQAATTSDRERDPVLLHVLGGMGHGVGASKDQQLRGDIDKRAFVMWQLGMFDGEGEADGSGESGAPASAVSPVSAPVTALWQGVLINRPAEMEVELTVEIGEAIGGGLAGTLDVPAYGLEYIPLEELRAEGDEVAFQFRRYSENLQRETVGAFAGRLSADGGQLAGSYSEAGHELHFELQRAGEPGSPRVPPPERPLAILSDGDGELRDAFNQHSDAVRLVLLLSPT